MSRTIRRINRSRPPPMYILASFSRVRRSGVRVMYPTLPLLTLRRINLAGAVRQRGEGRLRRPEAVRPALPDAGGRTRTSKGVSPQRDLNPPRLPVPPRPPAVRG